MSDQFLDIDLSNMGKEDFFFLYPNAFLGNGEPGDEFSPEFKGMLWHFAAAGYWPVDFSEGNNTYSSLWLKRGTLEVAAQQCEYFIKRRGQV